MNVGSSHMAVGDSSSKDGTARLLEFVSKPSRWYEADDAEGEKLGRSVMELVSLHPQHVSAVLEALVGCLAQGEKDTLKTAISVGGRSFASRSELKGECRNIVNRVPEGAELDPKDAALLRELLEYHPRGAEKVRGIQGIAVGKHAEHTVHDQMCFYVVRKDGREDFSYVRCIENLPTCENRSQDRVCEVLCAVLQVHPAKLEMCARSIEECFPKHVANIPVERFRNWVRSILYLCCRFAVLTEYLMTILIRQMVKVDVEMTKQEDDDGDIPDNKLENAAQILDTMMLQLFEFLQRRLCGSSTQAIGVVENRLVATFFQIFETVVLSTHRTRSVQFLFFYIASLRPAWTELFLSLLLRTMYSSELPMMKRHISVAYLASFVARASYLTPKYSLRTTQYMSAFAREHLQTAEHLCLLDELSHPLLQLFTLVVQAVCYIICFKASVFGTELGPTGQSMLDLLLPFGSAQVPDDAFTPVLESTCLPLERISDHIVRQFYKSVRAHCPLVDALFSRRPRRPRARSDADGPDGMDVFFPFDPYRLRHSHMYLKGIYREWSADGDGEDSDSEEDASSQGGAPAAVANAGAGGFRQQAAEMPVGRVPVRSASQASEDGGSDPDDFADPGLELADRGFVPSCGPSPAFQPRRLTVDEMMVSPLCMPMEGIDGEELEDGFNLPLASVDTGVSLLDSMLNTPAYVAGRC